MTTNINPAPEATTPQRRGRKANAARAASLAVATGSLTTTGTPSAMTMPDAPPDGRSDLELIQAAIDALPETHMATWVIEILCQATAAPQFRPVFRAAAEQKGEAGVYRLLQVMTKNCHHTHHGQLRMAASQSIATARINGRGILTGPRESQALDAHEMAHKVAHAAKYGCRLQDLDQHAGPMPRERDEC